MLMVVPSSSLAVQETDVTNKVYGIIAGVPVPFPLPEADACKLGVTCPISANTAVTEVVSIPISKAYPSVSLTCLTLTLFKITF